jgi:hypothetical protein
LALSREDVLARLDTVSAGATSLTQSKRLSEIVVDGGG